MNQPTIEFKFNEHLAKNMPIPNAAHQAILGSTKDEARKFAEAHGVTPAKSWTVAKIADAVKTHLAAGLEANEAATAKADDGEPKEPVVMHDKCEKCGFGFPKPQARATCRVETACKARQEGRPTRGRQSSSTKSTAATTKAEQIQADKAAHKAENEQVAQAS